jgi:dihydropyrimidinase
VLQRFSSRYLLCTQATPKIAYIFLLSIFTPPIAFILTNPSLIPVQDGTVVNADRQFRADVLIRDNTIAEVGHGIKPSRSAQIIDATGKLVMPGGIDPHTHLAMPFMGQVACDDFYTGHAAALAGGTTFHIDFALPVDGDLIKGYQEWRKKGENAAMDYGFHMAVTSWDDKIADQMGKLADRHGINSFKFFMAYKNALMVTDEQLLAGMTRCREIGALVQVHGENGDAVAEGQKRIFNSGITGPEGHGLSRPPGLEGEATARAARLAEFVNTPLYVVHVMSNDAAEEITRARSRGARIIGETVTSAIALDESKTWDANFTIAAQYVMSPPIRSKAHNAAIKAALAGGQLQLLGTDHAVFNSTQKLAGKDDFRIIPNGVNGLEERMHVAWHELVNTGLISPTDFVRITSTAAAQIFNIYPKKGVVQPGSDADIILFDPGQEHVISAATHHSAMDTNVYEGMKVRGKVTTTISRGKIVWHEGKLAVERGSGQYVPLPTGGPLFAGLDARDKAARSGAPVKRGEVVIAEEGGAEEAVKDEL